MSEFTLFKSKWAVKKKYLVLVTVRCFRSLNVQQLHQYGLHTEKKYCSTGPSVFPKSSRQHRQGESSIITLTNQTRGQQNYTLCYLTLLHVRQLSLLKNELFPETPCFKCQLTGQVNLQ